MADIIDRICETALPSKPKLAGLLRHLVRNGGENGLTAKEITEAGLFESQSDDTVRTECKRLRAALHCYFLYHPEGREETEQVDLPPADENHRRYKIDFGKKLHAVSGAAAFWRAHFLIRADDHGRRKIFGSKIIFTEPLMFRDKKRRLFIRHLDINDRHHEEVSGQHGDPRDELIAQLPWITDRNDIVVSRGYVPGGEVIAKDKLQIWFTQHLKEIKDAGGHVKTPRAFVQEAASRKVPDINALDNANVHCILLGSSRANWVIRYFQRETKKLLPCSVEADGIVIQQCSDAEFRKMQERLRDLKGSNLTEQELLSMIKRRAGGALLIEDWSKISFTLLSRTDAGSSEEIRNHCFSG